jgi:hypothetical protein
MQAVKLSEEIVSHELEPYVLQLETDGLTVVPPEVTGVTGELIDRCTDQLLRKFTEMTGCPISIENGPEGDLVWPENTGRRVLMPEDAPDPTQMLIQQLLQLDRSFRDLFVNPVVDALITHTMGGAVAGQSPRRLSSTNSFVKWQGDFGYGDTLGLHGDQAACPLPWGHTALTANATWCLTDYTHADGALAYVPGSHKLNAHPSQPAAAKAAVPVECPRGSVIVWPGSTWHGAYPKSTRGLRLNAVAYYRHHSVLPQENLVVTMAGQPWDDCERPEVMRQLIGFDDVFPYLSQNQSVPKLAAEASAAG